MLNIFKNLIILFILVLNQASVLSFVAHTVVRTPLGYRNIASLGQGDFVYSYHERLGVLACRVTKISIKSVDQVIRLQIGSELILALPDQFFYSVLRKKWAQAKDLLVGEQLLADCNQPVLMLAVEQLNQSHDIYQIELDKVANFFITSSRIIVAGFNNNQA